MQDRQKARELHQKAGLKFFEIFVNTPLEECEKRDVKGLYKKARDGQIKGKKKRFINIYFLFSVKLIFFFSIFVGFTGIDQVYEAPDKPDLSLDTVNRSIKDTMMEVITLLENNVNMF